MTPPVADAGSVTNAVQVFHVLGFDFSYEKIGRIVATIVLAYLVGFPAARRLFANVIKPSWAFLQKVKASLGKVSDAFEGAAWLNTARVKIDDCIERVVRVECYVAMNEALKRAEWNATAESRIKFDHNCRLTFANQTSLAIMRLDSTQAAGMGWQNAVTEMYRDNVSKQMRAAAADKRDAEIAFPIDTAGSTTNAEHFVLHLNAIPNGTPGGFGGFVGWFSYRDGAECGLAPICPLGLDKRIARPSAT